MSDKVWSQEQREEAGLLLDERRLYRPGFHSEHENRSTIKGEALADMIDLQCELTAKDAGLAEAVELLNKLGGSREFLLYLAGSRFAKEMSEWVERNRTKEAPDGER